MRNLLLHLLPMPKVHLDEGCQVIPDKGRAHRIARSLRARWGAMLRAHHAGRTVESIAHAYAIQIVPDRCRNSDAAGLIEHALIVEINRGISDQINPFMLPTDTMLASLGRLT